MASPTIKRGKKKKQEGDKSGFLFTQLKVPLLPRRLAAWTVEVSLIAASALVPYGIGVYANSYSQAKQVPLNPVLAETEEAIAKILALPRQPDGEHPVAPSTNLFWWIALITPVALTSRQVYLLNMTGQTSPKRWFGVRVVNLAGENPSLLSSLFREGLGRWGLPLGLAYMIWRYSGAFPDLSILLGLAGLTIIAETGILLFSYRRRTFHDHLSGTIVVDAKKGLATYDTNKQLAKVSQSITVETSINGNSALQETETEQLSQEGVTTVLLTTTAEQNKLDLWQWMRQHPGTSLLILAFAAMGSILGTFVGTQIYIQSQANQREFQQQNNELYLSLIQQLSSTSINPVEERRTAILAIARLDDHRAVPLLVDLLGQEQNPALIETIQQVLASTGAEALSPLRNLNQSLYNDLKALPQNDSSQEKRLIALRIRATKRAIAKLLTLHSGQLENISLHRSDLSFVSDRTAPFTLVLDKVDLSGINFRGAILNKASLKGSRFYSAGEDERLGTFDDWIADLSGVDLKEADLTGATLNNVSINRTNLIRATLNRANLSHARLRSANLSSAQLIGANLSDAILEDISLTGAELGEAQLVRANLRNGNLGQVSAIGTDFSFAYLTQSNWQGADLSSANLSYTNLQNADLSSTQLTGANLRNAKLQNANLQNANLSAADLRGANLAGANFQGVTFAIAQPTTNEEFLQAPPIVDSIANIQAVNFTKVKNLTPIQIDFICTQGGYHPNCR